MNKNTYKEKQMKIEKYVGYSGIKTTGITKSG